MNPVKIIIGAILSDGVKSEEVFPLIEKEFSAIDFVGRSAEFTETDYYEEEMGVGLKRLILSCDKLVDPSGLVEAKYKTQEIETLLSIEAKRTVNLDVGYLDYFKVVLASFKERGNKIYLGKEVWADMISYYQKGKFHYFPWSFPDFLSGKYDQDLVSIRNIYKKQLQGALILEGNLSIQ